MSITGFVVAALALIIVIAIIVALVRGGLAIIKPPEPIPQVVWLIVTVVCLLILLAFVTGNIHVPYFKV